jgi:hypothetical protein
MKDFVACIAGAIAGLLIGQQIGAYRGAQLLEPRLAAARRLEADCTRRELTLRAQLQEAQLPTVIDALGGAPR